ncbi:G-protein coupled receptor Mth2-like [Hyalella azteca]|uniref:G-protein coupled receptor Mth2-like n=1 Tax=Hyalella azteca TaxID=294128 RepID=A0A8B7PIC7_HYAAZ|nr:G-protein coupled receptor Mth2-like [Hyalella azteca]
MHISILRLNGNVCSPTDVAPIDVLIRPINNDIVSIRESNFGAVKVEELKCSYPSEVLLMSEKDYIMLLSGNIRHEVYNTLISSDQYCLEYIQHSNNMTEWVAMACVKPPFVQKCCSDGYLFDVQNLQCVEDLKNFEIRPGVYEVSEKSIFQPPIIIDDEAISSLGTDFTSRKGFPTCSEGEKLFELKIGNYSSNNIELLHYLHEVKLFVDHNNFSLQKYYNKNEFCVDGPLPEYDENKDFYSAVFCYDDPQVLHHDRCTKKNKHCIRKCCPTNEIIDMVSIGCKSPMSYRYLYQPTFYQSSWYDHMVPVNKAIPYEVVFGEPLCYPVESHEEFYLLDDGTVYIPAIQQLFTSENYCVDVRQGYVNQTDVVVHYCPLKGRDTCWRLRVTLYPVTMGVSCVFLMCTLILYKVVPELRVNISGKSFVSHVFSLLVTFICFLVIVVTKLSDRSTVLCQVAAFLLQYSYLATFFWLNGMCFEMWYRIRFLPTQSSSPSEARHKYKLYSVYGWGVPALITAVTAVVHFTVSQESKLAPNFGNPYCWFRDEPATWLYFSGIVMLLCTTNIFFFTDLAKISVMQCLGSSLIHVSRQQHMERIMLCLKLFIVMWVTWVFEEISYAEGSFCKWITTDLINILRGPLIFFSLVSTKSVMSKLKAKAEELSVCACGQRQQFSQSALSKGPAAASSERRVSTLALTRARKFSAGFLPTESGSHNSLTSVKTQETSIDPKSDSSFNESSSDSCRRESFELSCSGACASEPPASLGLGSRSESPPPFAPPASVVPEEGVASAVPHIE